MCFKFGLPPQMGLEFPGEWWGGVCKSKTFKEMYEA